MITLSSDLPSCEADAARSPTNASGLEDDDEREPTAEPGPGTKRKVNNEDRGKRRRIDEEGCYLIVCRHGVHRLKECQDCYVRSPEDQDFWERAMALVEAPSISSWYASRPSSTTVQGKR